MDWPQHRDALTRWLISRTAEGKHSSIDRDVAYLLEQIEHNHFIIERLEKALGQTVG